MTSRRGHPRSSSIEVECISLQHQEEPLYKRIHRHVFGTQLHQISKLPSPWPSKSIINLYSCQTGAGTTPSVLFQMPLPATFDTAICHDKQTPSVLGYDCQRPLRCWTGSGVLLMMHGGQSHDFAVIRLSTHRRRTTADAFFPTTHRHSWREENAGRNV